MKEVNETLQKIDIRVPEKYVVPVLSDVYLPERKVLEREER